MDVKRMEVETSKDSVVRAIKRLLQNGSRDKVLSVIGHGFEHEPAGRIRFNSIGIEQSKDKFVTLEQIDNLVDEKCT